MGTSQTGRRRNLIINKEKEFYTGFSLQDQSEKKEMKGDRRRSRRLIYRGGNKSRKSRGKNDAEFVQIVHILLCWRWSSNPTSHLVSVSWDCRGFPNKDALGHNTPWFIRRTRMKSGKLWRIISATHIPIISKYVILSSSIHNDFKRWVLSLNTAWSKKLSHV